VKLKGNIRMHGPLDAGSVLMPYESEGTMLVEAIRIARRAIFVRKTLRFESVKK